MKKDLRFKALALGDVLHMNTDCGEENILGDMDDEYLEKKDNPELEVADFFFRKDENNITANKWNDWKWQLKNRIYKFSHLEKMPFFSQSMAEEYREIISTYHFSATPYYMSLINWNDKEDPVLLQSMPDVREKNIMLADSEPDPLHETKSMPVPGLVHRYPDRCLVVVTNICAVYCRHCTRKRLWREPLAECQKPDLKRMVEYISQTKAIREVIVSGGDPLTMNMDKLDWFLGQLKAVPHVDVLRIGTRVPVVLPMRVTKQLCLMLKKHRPLWLNTQFNHPNEITKESQLACEMLMEAGIPVSNQSVLLKGVNDSLDTMRNLVHGLHKISVRPYYLFQCDPVNGTEHFRTSIWTGLDMMEKLRGHTSGMCIPQYVIDAPGGGGKIPVLPSYLLSASDDECLLRNYEGKTLRCKNPST